MDEINAKILTVLQSDGRISMQRLAKEIPMSVPAVCERVHKLEDSGAIKGYSAVIDPVKIGRTVNAYMLFSCNIGAIDDFLELIRNDEHVIKAHFLAGRFTMMLEVSFADMKDYAQFVSLLYPLGTSESYIKIDCLKDGSYEAV